MLSGLLQAGNVATGLIGGIGGLILGERARQDQNYWNYLQLEDAREKTEEQWRRDDTAWRRGRTDMLAAGINPLYNNAQPVSVSNAVGFSPNYSDMSGYFNSGLDAANTAISNAINTATSAKEIEKKGAEIEKLSADIEKIFSEIGVNDATIDQIRRNIRNMEAEEALIWQQFLTEIERTDNVKKDTLLKIAQEELTWEQKRLTANQVLDLKNKFADREWYNLYKRFDDAVKSVRESDLTAQQRRNAELSMYNIILEQDKFEHQKVMDELEFSLKKIGVDRAIIGDIMGKVAEGLSKGASGR